MGKISIFNRVKGLADVLAGKNRFDGLDFCTLKTMLMLAAVDGDISAEELARFKELSSSCRGYSDKSFAKLWEAALRSAGYLLLQTRFLPAEELTQSFVNEAARDFVDEVVLDDAKDRERAFANLEKMAMSDGDYSAIERHCISALAARVKEARDRAISERYSRAAAYGA